jgi:PhnB protein
MPKNKKSKKSARKPKAAARKKAKKKSAKPAARVDTSIAPWLCLRGGARAVEFYKSAFGAKEVFRMEDGGSVVARLSINGAEFWLSDESPEHSNFSPESLGGITTRIIFTVANPDTAFDRAVKAGAKQIHPMTDEYGWRIGRVSDPFGHHWEICRPL